MIDMPPCCADYSRAGELLFFARVFNRLVIFEIMPRNWGIANCETHFMIAGKIGLSIREDVRQSDNSDSSRRSQDYREADWSSHVPCATLTAISITQTMSARIPAFDRDVFLIVCAASVPSQTRNWWSSVKFRWGIVNVFSDSKLDDAMLGHLVLCDFSSCTCPSFLQFQSYSPTQFNSHENVIRKNSRHARTVCFWPTLSSFHAGCIPR